jgi:hypothetical protein
MTGPITADISAIAGGVAIVVSIGNVVWLHRLDVKSARLRDRLSDLEVRAKKL